MEGCRCPQVARWIHAGRPNRIQDSRGFTRHGIRRDATPAPFGGWETVTGIARELGASPVTELRRWRSFVAKRQREARCITTTTPVAPAVGNEGGHREAVTVDGCAEDVRQTAPAGACVGMVHPVGLPWLACEPGCRPRLIGGGAGRAWFVAGRPHARFGGNTEAHRSIPPSSGGHRSRCVASFTHRVHPLGGALTRMVQP
jgi:hypothetical protein